MTFQNVLNHAHKVFAIAGALLSLIALEQTWKANVLLSKISQESSVEVASGTHLSFENGLTITANIHD